MRRSSGMSVTGNNPPGFQGQSEAKVEAEVQGSQRGRLVRVVRRPRRSTWLYWLTAATSDIADSIERTNSYLEQDRPARAAEAFIDVFSLRRLAVLLPGGS